MGTANGNPYNGFSAAERTAAYNWKLRQYRLGRCPRRPAVCDACGQTEGHLEWHSEDYSAPFGDHIGQWGLCYRCHMLIHCRFRQPKVWDAYRQAVREGRRAVPLLYRAWGNVVRQLNGATVQYTQHEPRPGGLLERIHAGEFIDRGGANSSERRFAREQPGK